MLLCIISKTFEMNRKPEVTAGIFLMLTGFSVTITILTDVKFLTALSFISEDIKYISENTRLLYINSLLWTNSALLIIISAAALIAAIIPHQSFLGYLQGFFLFLAAGMFCFSGVKGLAINELLKNYHELDPINSDSLKSNILTLSKEKDIYLIIGYNLTGLYFFVIGIFSYITLKIPVFTGILASLTGILISLFTLFFPESIFRDIGLIMTCFMFFILSVRFIFTGLERKQRNTNKKKNNSGRVDYTI